MARARQPLRRPALTLAHPNGRVLAGADDGAADRPSRVLRQRIHAALGPPSIFRMKVRPRSGSSEKARLLVVLACGLLGVTCFTGDELVNQPCQSDADCNPVLDALGRQLRCQHSVCGYTALCGDGIIDVEVDEECDDGDRVRDDGCSEHCKTERCGDGIKQSGEACDDGNLEGSDGCSASCENEACGDGIVQEAEACDDGNMVDTDACVDHCKVAKCGDGFIQAGVEACDDGNVLNGDGCSDHCEIEGCGDGIYQHPEECDDGNKYDHDLCTNVCELARCGDGVQSISEECDDGNDVSSDDCIQCKLPTCGDGNVHEGFEECDDGDIDEEDPCLNMCVLNQCGDTILDRVEEACDDGNADYTDGCHECRARSTSIHGGAVASHACAARVGNLRCWGRNGSGQLGLGDSAAHGDDQGDLPVATDVLLAWALEASGASPVTAGEHHTCAIVHTNDGVRVACWGSNQFFNLGWETGKGAKQIYQGDEAGEMPPTLLDFGAEVPVELAAGAVHTCVRLEKGGVRCWGDNGVGQLGTPGIQPDQMLATDVDIGGKALQIVAGAVHNCALYEDENQARKVRCWGLNRDPFFPAYAGQLGQPKGIDVVWKPTAMLPLDIDGTIERIAAGAAHTCALLDGGKAMRCWGVWEKGALGHSGHGIPIKSEGAVGMLHPGDIVTKMALGYRHTCVLVQSGVRCWGEDLALGYGGAAYGLGVELPPLVELGEGQVDDLVAGLNWTCALIRGEVRCWGSNGEGQLGINSTDRIGDGPGEMPPASAMIYKQDALP